MGLRDWLNRAAGFFRASGGEGTLRPDGGTSCYRPARKKRGEETGTEREYAPENGGQQIPYAHTGFTNMNPPVDDGSMRQEFSSMGQEPAYGGMNNISYMPGAYAPDAGNSYTHVEHILVMTSLRSCYEAIECMKDGETLIIQLDAIANEGEAVRCQDMLAGAAFTLGCQVRMLNAAGIVLIAPEDVKILPEENRARPEMTPPVYTPQPASPEFQEQQVPRRERRVSQRTAEWNAARSGQSGPYNPYTGTMPAAAGDYGRFGGYGY